MLDNLDRSAVKIIFSQWLSIFDAFYFHNISKKVQKFMQQSILDNLAFDTAPVNSIPVNLIRWLEKHGTAANIVRLNVDGWFQESCEIDQLVIAKVPKVSLLLLSEIEAELLGSVIYGASTLRSLAIHNWNVKGSYTLLGLIFARMRFFQLSGNCKGIKPLFEKIFRIKTDIQVLRILDYHFSLVSVKSTICIENCTKLVQLDLYCHKKQNLNHLFNCVTEHCLDLRSISLVVDKMSGVYEIIQLTRQNFSLESIFIRDTRHRLYMNENEWIAFLSTCVNVRRAVLDVDSCSFSAVSMQRLMEACAHLEYFSKKLLLIYSASGAVEPAAVAYGGMYCSQPTAGAMLKVNRHSSSDILLTFHATLPRLSSLWLLDCDVTSSSLADLLSACPRLENLSFGRSKVPIEPLRQYLGLESVSAPKNACWLDYVMDVVTAAFEPAQSHRHLYILAGMAHKGKSGAQHYLTLCNSDELEREFFALLDGVDVVHDLLFRYVQATEPLSLFLCRFTDIVSLEIEHSDVTDRHLRLIALKCRKLQRLSLSQASKVTQAGLTALFQQARKLSSLKLEDLEGIDGAVFVPLAHHAYLTLRELVAVDLGSVTMPQLQFLLRKCKCLELLKVDMCEFPEEVSQADVDYMISSYGVSHDRQICLSPN